VASLALFYADVASDALLAYELVQTNNPIWSALTIFFMANQYFWAYVGVLLYLRSVYSTQSCAFTFFLICGLPIGPLILDVLMFFEPIGLMCLIPSKQLHYLLPAYRATRTLLEVTLEGLPQSFLQTYIYYRLQTAPESAGTLTEIPIITLEISLSLSIVSFLKAWIGAWLVARDQRMGLCEYLSQQLQMGAGVPINALRRNAIKEWISEFTLTDRQIEQLTTALAANTSLQRIKMRKLDLRKGESKLSLGRLKDGALGRPEAVLIASASTVPLLNSLEEVALDAGTPIPVKKISGATPTAIIDLSSKRLGANSTRMIAALLEVNQTPLPTKLHLGNNNLTSRASMFDGLAELCEVLAKRNTVASLNLANNFLCGVKAGKGTYVGEGIEAVANLVAHGGCLEELSLYSNRLGDKGVTTLAAAMRGNHQLTSVDLGENNIGLRGSRALAAALSEMSSLRALHLRGNAIDGEAAKFIGGALDASSSLTELNLSNNFLRAKGAKELAPAIAKSSTMRSLSLASNVLTDEGARFLAPAIAKSTSLQSIDLKNNSLANDAKKLLKEAVGERGRGRLQLLL